MNKSTVFAMTTDLPNHYKNRRLMSTSLAVLLGTLGYLFSLAPADLGAQQVQRGVDPQEIVQRLSQSGLSLEEIREQLLRAGYPPDMADAYFGMMEGGPPPGAEAGGAELLTALDELGIQLRSAVEVPFEDPLNFIPQIGPELDSAEVQPLQVFGKSFFERTASFQFQQLQNGAVGADYRLGPGDEVVLVLTGDVEEAYSVDVNRNGTIMIPVVGQISVSGLTISDLENVLYDRLGSVYSGVRRGGDATTLFDVSLGALRTIGVYITGEVERPNRYPLSAMATLLEALHAAGGPTEIGSLRRVRIERGQQSLGEFDLYPYFVDGSSSGDIRLENGDLIFVPPAESQVTLVGAVRREAIFEMRTGETASDLFKFAGGTDPDAIKTGTVDRVLPFNARSDGVQRVILDLPIVDDTGEEAPSSFEMFPGDSVTIHRMGDPYPRFECDELSPESETCDERRDLPSAFARNWVELEGAVWAPGIYQVTPGQTLADLLETGGGIRPDGFQSIIHISRTNQQTGQRSLIRTALNSAAETTIQEFDRVTLFGQDSLLAPDSVSIFGSVLVEGRYPYYDQMTAEDLVLLAGGFQRGSIPWEVEITQPVFDIPGVLSLSTTVALSGNLPYPDSSVTWPEESSLPTTDVNDVPLGPDFEVYIRELPGYEPSRHVDISGEVNRPGRYVLQSRDEKLTSIIERAGGPTDLAYAQGGRVTRLGIPVGTDFVQALAGVIEEDLVLSNGDQISIPVYDPTILVEGAVAFESRMRYRIGMDLGEVITNAGGYIYDADTGRVSVEYLNGQRETAKRILWLFKKSPRIEPGSRISVPLKSESLDSGFDWNTALSATLATLSAFATVYIALVR